MKRALYLDRIRIILTCLVMVHHTLISFGANGGWYYISSDLATGRTQMFLSLWVSVEQAFFMSYFFLISALLMPTSFDRKGFGKFVKDRLVRLGLPLVFYLTLLHPTVAWLVEMHKGNPVTWWQVVVYIFTKQPEPGPMWFVLALMCFELLYALWRRVTDGPSPVAPAVRETKPVNWYKFAWNVVVFTLGTGLIAFAVRLVWPAGKAFYGMQWGYFTLYVAMYIVGIVANRRNWLERLSVKQAKPWFYLAIAAIVIMLGVVWKDVPRPDGSGGWNYSALFYAMWEPFICVGFCFFFTLICRDHWNSPSPFVTRMSKASFQAFVWHPLTVVLATFVMESTPLPVLLKIAGTLLMAVPASFGLGTLLNLKRRN